MLSFAIFLLVAAGVSAGPLSGSALEERIVGGGETTIAHYPYTASIEIDGTHVCGGAVISTQYVLTAFHCIFQNTSGSWNTKGYVTIRLGSSTVNSNSGDVYNWSVITFIGSPWIMALIRLRQEIVFGPNVGLVRLPSQGANVEAGSAGIATGWGVTSDNTPSTILQNVSLPVISNEECKRYYGDSAITDNMLCAGSAFHGLCTEDEGGPLVVGPELVGIGTYETGCGRPNFPSVFIKVSAYSNTIQNHM